MAKTITGSRIDRRLSTDPLTVQGYVLRPVVRVMGRGGRVRVEHAQGGGLWAAIDPQAVTVQTPDGRFFVVATPDATAVQRRRLLRLSLIVTLAAWALLLAHRLWSRGETQ